MKKLTLNKEVIANLCSTEMNGVKGQTGNTCQGDTCLMSGCGCVYPTVAPWETCPVCIITDDDATCTCA